MNMNVSLTEELAEYVKSKVSGGRYGSSSEVVRELAIGGCGIALRSLWDVSAALNEGALRRVLPAYQGSQDVGIFAVHAPMPAVPARLRALIAHLGDHLRQRAAID